MAGPREFQGNVDAGVRSGAWAGPKAWSLFRVLRVNFSRGGGHKQTSVELEDQLIRLAWVCLLVLIKFSKLRVMHGYTWPKIEHQCMLDSSSTALTLHLQVK